MEKNFIPKEQNHLHVPQRLLQINEHLLQPEEKERYKGTIIAQEELCAALETERKNGLPIDPQGRMFMRAYGESTLPGNQQLASAVHPEEETKYRERYLKDATYALVMQAAFNFSHRLRLQNPTDALPNDPRISLAQLQEAYGQAAAAGDPGLKDIDPIALVQDFSDPNATLNFKALITLFRYIPSVIEGRLREVIEATELPLKPGHQLEIISALALQETLNETSNDFTVVRASLFDDVAHGVDLLIYNKKTDELVCGIDMFHGEERNDRMDKKSSTVEDANRRGGKSITYGMKQHEGKIKLSSRTGIPALVASVDFPTLQHALHAITINHASRGSAEKQDARSDALHAVADQILKSFSNQTQESKTRHYPQKIQKALGDFLQNVSQRFQKNH